MTAEVTLVQLCVGASDLALMLKISPRQVRRLNSMGELPAPVMLGGCTRWSVEELRAWIAAGAPSRERWEEMRRDES